MNACSIFSILVYVHIVNVGTRVSLPIRNVISNNNSSYHYVVDNNIHDKCKPFTKYSLKSFLKIRINLN